MMLPPGAPSSSAFFGRMFPHLGAFAEASDTVQQALMEVGAPGGIMDARDDLAEGPKALIVNPAFNGNPTPANPYGTNPDNPTMTAGSTFVGQFTDHDITFDQTSRLGVPQDPLISPNSRTPALDLDSVFGGGPAVRPDLYLANPDGTAGPELKIGTGGVHEDVPPGPQRRWHLHRPARRPAQRRERDDRRAAQRAHPVLQQGPEPAWAA